MGWSSAPTYDWNGAIMGSLRLLRTLIAVFDTGSVIGAARSRGYSPAAVSRQMGELQRQLGVALFVPAGRGIRPTEHAVSLVEKVRAVIVEADKLDAYMRSIRTSVPTGVEHEGVSR